jgi:hypothetical protein
MTGRGWKIWAGALSVLLAGPALALNVGMVDTFQDGSTNGWDTGGPSPNPPVNQATGGPAGAGDKYMLATASGVHGPGGKLVVFNTAQWLGDYTALGLTSITMDLDNFGGSALDLHLQLSGVGATAYTTNGVVLPAGSGWQHVTFTLLPAALTGAAATVLGGVTELRLYHGTSAAVDVAASLGVDNIAAVPEPGRALSLGAGLLALCAVTGSRQRRARHSDLRKLP